VATLATGNPVVCTAISSDQTWYKVTLPDQTGVFYVQVSDLQTGGKS
jgi:RPA family protein